MSQATPFPQTAIELSDQPDDYTAQDNDNDPKAALELVRDAIEFHDGSNRTALRRGSYEVVITTMPDHEADPTRYVLHLDCVTNTVIPNPERPGTVVQTTANLWVEPLDVAREMVTDYLGADALDEDISMEEGR